MPAVSVVLPLYNAEKTIAMSVASVLAQTFNDFSLLIVDDGSTDSSREIVATFDDPRIIFLQNDVNKGIEFSLNRGVASSDCEYIFRMDSDDICMPTRFAEQMEFLRQRPKTWVLGSWAEIMHEDGTSSICCMPVGNDNIRARLLFHAPLIHPSVAIKRELFNTIKYSNKYPAAEDYDLWCKLACSPDCIFDCIPRALLRYRLYGQTISITRAAEQKESTNQARTAFLKRLGIFDRIFALAGGEQFLENTLTAVPQSPYELHNIIASNSYPRPLSCEFKDAIENIFQVILKENKRINYCSDAALALEMARRFMAIADSIRKKQPELSEQMFASSLVPRAF